MEMRCTWYWAAVHPEPGAAPQPAFSWPLDLEDNPLSFLLAPSYSCLPSERVHLRSKGLCLT